MDDLIIIWDTDDDPDGNVVHIAEHDVTKEEVEEILQDPNNQTVSSRSSGRPITRGWTSAGRELIVVWEPADDEGLMVYPITAYESDS